MTSNMPLAAAESAPYRNSPTTLISHYLNGVQPRNGDKAAFKHEFKVHTPNMEMVRFAEKTLKGTQEGKTAQDLLKITEYLARYNQGENVIRSGQCNTTDLIAAMFDSVREMLPPHLQTEEGIRQALLSAISNDRSVLTKKLFPEARLSDPQYADKENLFQLEQLEIFSKGLQERTSPSPSEGNMR